MYLPEEVSIKYIFTLLLVFLISCGPSEEEIQARVNEAVENAISSTTTSTSSTTTSTSSTTTTTKLFNPGIEITSCPNSVIVDQLIEVEYIVSAPGSDIEEISTYWSWVGGKTSIVNFSNISTIDLPKKATTLSYISSNTPTGGSTNWETSFHITARNKQGQSSSAVCRVNVIVNSSSNNSSDSTTTTTTTTPNQGPIWSNDPISFSRINTTYLDILWGQANDPDGIAKYEIYVDGVFEKTVYGEDTRRTTIYGLNPGTNYNFEVKACDTLGNCSINNPTASKKTSGSSSSGSSSSGSYPATPSSSTWSRFNGSGDSVLDISSVGSNVLIAFIEYNGSGNFSVITRDSNLGYQGLMVNEVGNYSGTIPINFNSETNTYLDISATGSWEVVVKPIASADNFDSNSISGIGDSVIEAYELQSVDTLTINYTGSGNFSVTQYRCNGSYNYLLVNERGSYSGTVVTDSGTCFIEINAEGNWSITK